MTSASIKLTHQHVLRELKLVAREDKAKFLPGFFQAFPGGYGEGDQFLGVVVPDQRKIAKRYAQLPFAELAKLLASPWHECRLTALYILVDQFTKARREKQPHQNELREIVDFYLQNLDGINNWDLVDSSAHKILGLWLLENSRERKILRKLAKRRVLWEQRIAVIATMPLIHAGEFDDFLELAEQFLSHPHDLMHKAVGWMLRETGKQNMKVLETFLATHVAKMPRTMLRYAIEKMPPADRQSWLQR